MQESSILECIPFTSVELWWWPFWKMGPFVIQDSSNSKPLYSSSFFSYLIPEVSRSGFFASQSSSSTPPQWTARPFPDFCHKLVSTQFSTMSLCTVALGFFITGITGKVKAVNYKGLSTYFWPCSTLYPCLCILKLLPSFCLRN